jgi:hypothetical protein
MGDLAKVTQPPWGVWDRRSDFLCLTRHPGPARNGVPTGGENMDLLQGEHAKPLSPVRVFRGSLGPPLSPTCPFSPCLPCPPLEGGGGFGPPWQGLASRSSASLSSAASRWDFNRHIFKLVLRFSKAYQRDQQGPALSWGPHLEVGLLGCSCPGAAQVWTFGNRDAPLLRPYTGQTELAHAHKHTQNFDS